MSVSDDTRDINEEQDEESTDGNGRRKMIKSAAALAAAALGGAALGGSQADAQIERKPLQVQGQQLQLAQPSPLIQNLKIRELSEPLKNLGQLDPNINQDMVPIILTDIGEYLQPLLDRGGGQVSDITVNVANSVTVSG
jgi:hypothetical protein